MAFLQVHNLSYRYPDGTPALDRVSFGIDEGQAVGLVGPNGAGKSTLMLHLNGLLPGKTEGIGHHHGAGQGGEEATSNGPVPAVQVAGLPVIRENFLKVRRSVGLLFQDPDDQLFCPTVREDVAFGPLQLDLPRTVVLERVQEMLQLVSLSGYEDRIPHHLSFGERKRVCLAGVLACQPQLLVLDEPTANLDPRSRRQLIGILQNLKCTLLVASHDLELIVELCPRVLVLDQGRIQADGKTSDLLSKAELMDRHGLEVPWSLR